MAAPLSSKALDWLATLPREPAIATREIETLIVDAGHVPHAVWLDFHDRYAGYVEEVGGGDIAYWGLARHGSQSRPSGTVWIRDPDPKWGSGEEIACADAHPEHEYELTASGHFRGVGGPCPSFEIKVERHGLLHALYARGPVQRTLIKGSSRKAEHDALLHTLADALVPYASDEGTLFYAQGDLVVEHVPRFEQMVCWRLQK